MSSLLSLNDASAPGTAVEIASGRVSAAALDWRGGQAVVSAHAVEPLPPAALVPSLTAANVHDRPAIVTALNRALERLGRPRRVGLVIPDVVGKVSLVRFENIPARASDLDQLVRWQVRKAAPFPIEEAQVSYVRGFRAEDGQELIVSLARRAIVEEYEGLCAEAGAHAGVVDLATFNVINAVLAGTGAPVGDWLLVNVAADYASIAIVRGADLIFFRNRAAETDGTLADLVHQTAMYYQDRLKGGGFSRVMLAGGGEPRRPAGAPGAPGTDDDIDVVRCSLEERLGMPVETVDPRSAAALTDRIAAAPAFLDTLAPLVGMLLRDRDRHAARV
jgi:Tfp pilus assembly PilM family ATPase